jgi:hypothetical protein
MAIDTVEFNLSMTDVDTGEYLTGRTYSLVVTDADGVTQTTLSNLSIAQLVMAVCLERAVKIESDIIATMNDLNRTSSELQALTEMENDIVTADGKAGNYIDLTTKTLSSDSSKTYYAALEEMGIDRQILDDSVHASSESADLITAIEKAMDQRNSINQETMINLQSITSKRDQSYDMIANISKSLYQVATGIVNNV